MMKKIFVLFSFLLFLSSTFALADVCVENKCLWAELYKWIWNRLNTTNEWFKWINKKIIVENFCDVIYKFDSLPDKSQNAFKTKESLFLQLLCATIWKWKENSLWIEFRPNKYNYFTQLTRKNSIYSKCHKTNGYTTDSESMNDIDFVCVAWNIFKEIESNYTDIALFFALWGGKSEEIRNKWEKDYYNGYDKKYDCGDSYIMSEEEDKRYCIHKRTNQYFKEVRWNVNSMIQNLSLIKITPDEAYEKLSSTKSTEKAWAVLMSIKDRLYTELYFYNIFLTYYSTSLKMFNSYVSLKRSTTNAADLQNLNGDDEILNWKKNVIVSNFAVEKSLDMIKNIYWTYPIHIGFLAITEDLDKLREAISKIYTPIDQLRHKGDQAQDEGEDKK